MTTKVFMKLVWKYSTVVSCILIRGHEEIEQLPYFDVMIQLNVKIKDRPCHLGRTR